MQEVYYIFHDIVLLGPRDAGKTSIAELWTQPWFNISEVQPSDDWQTYQASIFDIGSETRKDELFGVDRTYDLVLRVRIHDHPGDDYYQTLALKKLPTLKNPTLLLFFDLDANEQGIIRSKQIDNNHTYYSKYFAETLEGLTNITRNVSEVIVVFNKVDVLPQSWDKRIMISKLCEVNSDAIARIRKIFGVKVKYWLVSTRDNRGMISLLGEASAAGLSEQMKASVERRLEKLFKDAVKPADAEHKKN